MSDKLVDALANMQEDEAIKITKQLLSSGTGATKILDDCRAAMEIVGKRFETGEYFLPELIMAGEMLKEISVLVKPLLTGGGESKKLAKVIIGTVKGDIHDIGKDIVVFMLDVNGFDVYDLGIDVAPEIFVKKVAEIKPAVLGLSGFLTLAFDSMKETVAQLKAAGLRDNLKIMVGGGTVDDHVRVYAEADAYGTDAMAAVSLTKKWTGVK